MPDLTEINRQLDEWRSQAWPNITVVTLEQGKLPRTPNGDLFCERYLTVTLEVRDVEHLNLFACLQMAEERLFAKEVRNQQDPWYYSTRGGWIPDRSDGKSLHSYSRLYALARVPESYASNI